MRHRIFFLFSALSLLLCVTTCVLWARSHHTSDRLRKSFGTERLFQIQSYRGVLIIERDWLVPDSEIASSFQRVQWDSEPFPQELGYEENGDGMNSIFWRKAGWSGFGFDRQPFEEGVVHAVVIPFWFIALMSGLAPAKLVIGWIRRRSPRPGHCSSCGYDLRATPGKCPECGTTPARAGGK